MPKLENGYGCLHYDRDFLIICNMCNRTYPCHFCHDKSEDHSIDRIQISEIVCLICGMVQKKANVCIKCNFRFGKYFCSICSIWSKEEKVFHCSKCKMCALGCSEMFEHCNKCDSCIEKGHKDHNHVDGGIKNNCPICAENMLGSFKQAILLRCGHSMHEECYFQIIKNSINCPICFRIVGDDDQIRRQIKSIVEQSLKDIPGQEIEKCNISCFECGYICFKQKYPLFNICDKCGSYNTKIMYKE